MAQDIAYKNFEQPSNQGGQAKATSQEPSNLTLQVYWKTKLAKMTENWVNCRLIPLEKWGKRPKSR